MNYPKISIIIPSFNQGQFLEEAIQSVINQDYPNLELFVVDGGSTDNSVEIIKKYEQSLNWWVSEKDSGQSEAINKGMRRASGEIVNWICSDDLLTPGALKNVAEYYSKVKGEAGVIHGGTTIFDEKRILRKEWGYENPSVERNLAAIAFSQPSAFLIKKYFDMVGGKVEEKMHFGMDYDLYTRLVCVCKFVPVNDIFSKYRFHEKSKSVAEQEKFSDEWGKIFVNLCKNLNWDDIIIELQEDHIYSEEVMSWFSPFLFQVNSEIVKNADKKRILFYHLCSLLKSVYFAGDRDRSKKIVFVLKRKYPVSWIRDEKHLSQIITRLRIPESLLKILAGIKKRLKLREA